MTPRQPARTPPLPSILERVFLWITSTYKPQLGASFLVASLVCFSVLTLFPAAPKAFPDPGLGLMAFFVAPFVATAVALIFVGRWLRRDR